MAKQILEIKDVLPTAEQEGARSVTMKGTKDFVRCSRYLHVFDQDNSGKLKQSLPSDLVEDIFLRLPLKSLVRFKAASKEWRSLLESKSFIEMHLNLQKSVKRHQKILVAYKCDCCDRPNLSPEFGSVGDEEISYLHCNTSGPFMSCDGLVCLPEPGWVNVVNPSTREVMRFPSGPDPVPSAAVPRHARTGLPWLSFFPGFWAMGFGRDQVTGSYKVVRMFFDPLECDVLTVETNGQWRRHSPPPYRVDTGRRSAYVNGSIYWLEFSILGAQILAMDLHTEEFRDVKFPPPYSCPRDLEILNIDDRLALSMTERSEKIVEIYCMVDSKEEKWSKTYSICIAHVAPDLPIWATCHWWFTPVIFSKEGNVLMCDNHKSLFKHCLRTNVTRRLTSSTCWVICPYLESLVRLNI